jgi:hypothetical protein
MEKNGLELELSHASKALIGSQQVPYIYEDRISQEDFVDALTKMYEMSSEEERQSLGDAGRQHIIEEL